MTHITRVTQITVLPEGEPTYSERATIVEIEDDAGGEFVIVDQSSGGDYGKVAIDPDEWPTLRAAIDRMVAECRPEGEQG